MKRFVTSEPYISSEELEPTDTHIVLACDGLWDVLSDDQVADVVQTMPESTSALVMAKKLLLMAIKARTSDNVTCMVIKLQK